MRRILLATLAVAASVALPARAEDNHGVRIIGEASTLSDACGVRVSIDALMDLAVKHRVLPGDFLSPDGRYFEQYVREQALVAHMLEIEVGKGKKRRVAACDALVAAYGPAGRVEPGLAKLPDGYGDPVYEAIAVAIRLDPRCPDWLLDRDAAIALAAGKDFAAIEAYAVAVAGVIGADLPADAGIACLMAENKFGPKGTMAQNLMRKGR